MTSTMRAEDRLDALEHEIDMLRTGVLGLEREAGQLLDGEDAANTAHERMLAAQMLLRARLDLYYDVVREQRARSCKLHGSSIIAACSDCRRIHDLDRTRAA